MCICVVYDTYMKWKLKMDEKVTTKIIYLGYKTYFFPASH